MATTLTVSEILSDVMQAFKTKCPALNFFSHDYGSQQVKYGQTIIAQIPTVPTAYSHTAANGYNQNAQSARSLLTDVSVVMDQWTDVPIKLLDADVSQDKSENYLKTITNAGYVLGKTVADFALGKVLAANFSKVTTAPIAGTNKDTLNDVRVGMNGVNAGTPRNMLCSSDFFGALDSDVRVTSGDYYGQKVAGDPFGRLSNIAGFSEIVEYPQFPANGENLSAIALDPRAIALATRLPMDSTDLAQRMGLPQQYKSEVLQDPDTGLAIAAFSWIDVNTHYIYITFSVMYGAVAGSQGGAAGALTDYAGWRVRTSA